MSQRHSQLLRMAKMGHNLNKSLEGSFHREEGAEEQVHALQSTTAHLHNWAAQPWLPQMSTQMCSQMTCHQKLLEVSGLHSTQQ